jgi:hypothetical protein
MNYTINEKLEIQHLKAKMKKTNKKRKVSKSVNNWLKLNNVSFKKQNNNNLTTFQLIHSK